MKSVLLWLKRAAIALAIVAATFLAIRTWDMQRGAALEPWHTYVPKEIAADRLDKSDWDEYIAAEDKIFEAVRREVTQRLPPEDRQPINRYFEGSIIYPGRFARDWNRSYVLVPDAPPIGAVVLLHGLTDSPYSTRHIAERYRDHGYLALAVRLPAHGTVPGALTDVHWQDWMAATRLAIREARRRIDPAAPLHLVGFSNGGALAVKYTLDALEDKRLARPTRVVLLSPMIGVTRFARFAGFAGLPAVLPAFAKAAWLGIVPEFNPFKYNSFPINGAKQSHELTMALQKQIGRLARERQLTGIAPVLTFQSVVDFTVSTRAILSALYARLPANGSEIVLFDVNRTVLFGPLMRTTSYTAVERLLPPLPQDFRITIVSNAGADDPATIERRIEAGATEAVVRPLGIDYPKQVFSLSHVAIPFPVDDSLYGYDPAPGAEFGLNLGAVMARGERGALIMNLESLFRIASNPFFAYLIERIEEGLTARSLDAADAADTRFPATNSASPGTLLVHPTSDTGHAPHVDANPLPLELEHAQPDTEPGP